MRIAVITTSYPAYEGDPSGHFVATDVAELERAGHEVRVLRPMPGGAFGWPGVATRLREQPLRALEAATWALRASAALRRLSPDRVVAHWCVPSGFPIALAGAPRRAELELVSHGGDVRLLSSLPEPARAALVQALLSRATRWRFVSEALVETLAMRLSPEDTKRLRERVVVAPTPIEVPDVRAEALLKRSRMGARRLYVCAARLVASKRVDRVIDYVATSDGHGTSPRERALVVLGDGPERPRLERLARAWQLDARFLGTTPRREALSWIGAADELVHASRAEGLSTVVREASALGVRVTLLAE